MSTPVKLTDWEPRFRQFLDEALPGTADAAHDGEHIRRVVANARRFAAAENAALAVVIPAAWLHDCVIVPKNSPLRARASRLAAEQAVAWLAGAGYPSRYLPAIDHAIAAHSFSAQIPPETLEAKVVQDADRVDALGAIGMARTFMVGGALTRPLYHPEDPFCADRPPDDTVSTLDHFYTKLFKLPEMMQTAAGRAEADRRAVFMRDYIAQFSRELPA